MKILMVTNTYLPIVGGLEKSISSFARKFRELGHEVMIAVPELEENSTTEEGVVQIPAVHPFKRNDFSIAIPLFGSLTKVVESFQPDIIHSHHPFLMGETALRLSSHYAKPLVFTYHIMFDHYAHYLPIPAPLSKRFLTELAVGYANLSTRVIVPSESVRDILNLEGITAPMDVVPTGVDLKMFAEGNGAAKRKSLGILSQDKVFGYVGRIAPEKNLEFLAKVMSDFMKTHSNVHFLMAGKGPSEDRLKHIFNHTGLRERFHFLGVVLGQDLTDAYHAMDAFVFSSKSETQGMVLCEAMAAGIPVIAIDSPGVREVVKDMKNGRLILSESEKEFHSALSECLKYDDEKWKKLKRKARQTAEIFSDKNCARRALQVYQKALTGNPSFKKQDDWHSLIESLRAEWKIMANFGRATGLALKEMTNSFALIGDKNHDELSL